MNIRKRARYAYAKHVRLRVWSIRNWAKGYAYGPVQRFRCCAHTTPFHTPDCSRGARAA